MSRVETGARASAFCAVVAAALSLFCASSSLASNRPSSLYETQQPVLELDFPASKPALSKCRSEAPIYRLRSNVPCRTARSVSRRSGLGSSAPGWKCEIEKARSEGVYLVSCKRRNGNGLVRYDYVAGGKSAPRSAL